jgi:hypothetical protein
MGNSDALGAGCGWGDHSVLPGPTNSLGVTWSEKNTGGLSDMYAQRSMWSYFKPTMVQGYPAVFGTPGTDDRGKGDCEITVGVNNHLTFFADYEDEAAPKRACPMAKRTASAVIDTLKKANQ